MLLRWCAACLIQTAIRFYRFPVRVDGLTERQRRKGGCITSGCGHKYHLLVRRFPKVILPGPALRGVMLHSGFHAVGVSAGRSYAPHRMPAQLLVRQAVSVLKKMHHRSYRTATGTPGAGSGLTTLSEACRSPHPMGPVCHVASHFAFCSQASWAGAEY